MLTHFRDTPNCVESCAKPGFLKELEKIAEDLELCEKALADFLEQKRTFFPRFYFVSQTMLLDILSNGNRPWVVLKNVNAMMQGVKECALTGDPAINVINMVSNEGEIVKFDKMGNLTCKGKVEEYLTDLLCICATRCASSLVGPSRTTERPVRLATTARRGSRTGTARSFRSW